MVHQGASAAGYSNQPYELAHRSHRQARREPEVNPHGRGSRCSVHCLLPLFAGLIATGLYGDEHVVACDVIPQGVRVGPVSTGQASVACEEGEEHHGVVGISPAQPARFLGETDHPFQTCRAASTGVRGDDHRR